MTHTLLTVVVNQGWMVFEQMLRALDPTDPARANLRRMRDGLAMLVPRLTRCELVEREKRKPLTPPSIGTDTRDILLLNFLIPFAGAWARAKGVRAGEEAIHAMFGILPRLPENRVERVTYRRMFGAPDRRRSIRKEPFLRSARFQQGLHRIHEDFCSKGLDGCERCPIPSSMAMEAHQA